MPRNSSISDFYAQTVKKPREEVWYIINKLRIYRSACKITGEETGSSTDRRAQ